MPWIPRYLMVTLSLLMAASCAEETKDEPGPYPLDVVDVTWAPCSLYEGADDGLAECATVAMPLDWEAPDERAFEVRAKRLLAGGEAHVQLWLLDGGPGAAGTYDFPDFMEYLRGIYPGVDLYTLDHRGTGHSGRLSCPEQESPDSPSGEGIATTEYDACLDYLRAERADDLPVLTSSQSAIDLAALIHASAEDGKRRVVFGGSYGSYWAQRYLLIYPEQVDGAIISGIFPADGSVVYYDEHNDRVGEQLFVDCGEDPACAAKLGDDPWGRLREVLEKVEGGHCTDLGLDRPFASLMMAYMMYSRSMASLVPAFAYRLDRCEPADEQVIYNVYLVAVRQRRQLGHRVLLHPAAGSRDVLGDVGPPGLRRPRPRRVLR